MTNVPPDMRLVLPVPRETESLPRSHHRIRERVCSSHDLTVLYERLDDPTMPCVQDTVRTEESKFKLLRRLHRYVPWCAHTFRYPRAS